jgi:hypothetical protein
MAGPAHHNFVAFQSCEKQEHCILGEKSEEGLPSMIVFDLDDCLWTPEMHELSGKPSLPVEGPLDPLVENSPLGIIGMRVRSRRGMWDGEDGEWRMCLPI